MATQSELYLDLHNTPEEGSRRFRIIDGAGWTQTEEPGNDLGYHLVPAENFAADTPLYSWATAYYRGLGKASLNLLRYHLGGLTEAKWPIPEGQTVTVDGREREVLVSQRQTEDRNGEDGPMNTVLAPGLFETDMGSALRLHIATAERHPERRTVTILTPGISIHGGLLSVHDGLTRTIEETAVENYEVMRTIVGDEPTKASGTSFGSAVTSHMAAHNLSQNGSKQLTLTGLDLLSPAVGVRDVDWGEVEQPYQPDASDPDLVDQIANEFYKHMPLESIRMALRHPEGAGEVVAAAADYVLAPQKLLRRIATIAGNIRAAKQGIDYADLKSVAQAYDLHVLGGELCPLVQATIPQYEALSEQAPRTMLWVVKGVGHGMTLNAKAVAKTAAQMEQAASELPIAA